MSPGDKIAGRKRKRPALRLNDAQIKRSALWKSQAQPTPWVDCFEFSEVGKALVSAADAMTVNSEAINRALERVAVWRARSHRLPHGVDASAALAQVLWREHCAPASCCSTTELQLLYASAVIRSINGVVDSLDQDRAVATSVAQRSNQLGIPTWLVEIRHKATHNELPPLAVLRMAATTLLHYFQAVYWGPLDDRRLHYEEQARILLEDYRQALANIGNQESSGDSLTISNLPHAQDGTESLTVNGTDNAVDSKSSDEDDRESDATHGYNGSKLGTFFNSFAALQEPKKKKKKDLPEAVPAEPLPKMRKKKRKRPKTAMPTSYECARRFVKAGLPMDIAYRSVLHFLVDEAFLAPNDPDKFPQTSAGIRRLRHHHSTLLVTLAKEWPGFAAAVLVRLVDSVLSLERSVKNLEGRVNEVLAITRRVFFFSSWVEYLLSDSFLAHVNLTSDHQATTRQVSRMALQSLDYPLASLRDRCRPFNENQFSEGSRVHFLYEILNDILIHDESSVVDRFYDTGVIDMHEPAPPSNSDKDHLPGPSAPLQQNHSVVAACNETQNEEIELSGVTTDTIETTVRWTLCDSWEPCSIGALPGHP